MRELLVVALTRHRAGTPRVVASIDKRLTVVAAAGIAAIVRRTASAPASSPARLVRHHSLVQRLAGHLPALLPVRYPTLVGRDELLAMLAVRGAAFARALRLVRQRVQMTVHVAGGRPTEEPVARLPRPAREQDPAQTGTAFLRARAAAAARARAVPAFEPLRPAVRRWVKAEHVEHGATHSTIHQLIPRSAAAAYVRALQSQAAAHGIVIRVSGPFAPYAFATTGVWEAP